MARQWFRLRNIALGITAAIGTGFALLWAVSLMDYRQGRSRSPERTVEWWLGNGEIGRRVTTPISPAEIRHPPTRLIASFGGQSDSINLPTTLAETRWPGIRYELQELLDAKSGLASQTAEWHLQLWLPTGLAFLYPTALLVLGPLRGIQRRLGFGRFLAWTVAIVSIGTSLLLILLGFRERHPLGMEAFLTNAVFAAAPGILALTGLWLFRRRKSPNSPPALPASGDCGTPRCS